MNEVALMLQGMGRLNEALALLEESLGLWSSMVPEEESSVATAYNNMGIVCNKMGMLQRAANCHKEALDIRLRLQGRQVPFIVCNSIHVSILEVDSLSLFVFHHWQKETAESLYNLASVHAHSGDCETARMLFLRSAEIYAQVLVSSEMFSPGILICPLNLDLSEMFSP